MEEAKDNKELTEEEIAAAKEASKDGSADIRLAMIEYAKRMNGYPYISASRIERIPGKDDKAMKSMLYEQLVINYLMKTPDPNALDDFEKRFCNGQIVFFQAHASCPTMGVDGLYNSRDLNGKYIKSQILGHFALTQKPFELTNDETAEEGYSYFYKDPAPENENMYIDLGLKTGTPLENFRTQYSMIYKRLTKPEFTPIIVVKQAKDKYGMIIGDPYPKLKPEELAAVLKKGSVTEVPEQPIQQQ